MKEPYFNLIEEKGNYTLEINWWRKPRKICLSNKAMAIIKANEFVAREKGKVCGLEIALKKFRGIKK